MCDILDNGNELVDFQLLKKMVWFIKEQFQVKVFTNAEPRNMHHSVEFSAGGATGASGVIWKLKVEDKHNDQAVFILNGNHIDHTVKTNA